MANDKDQFIAELVVQNRGALEKFLAQRLDNPEDAAEIAQEAFLRLHRLDDPGRLDNARAYLYQVAGNLAIDQLRRRKLHFRFLAGEMREHPDDGVDTGAAEPSPEQILGASQRLAAINAAVESLPFKAKQAFLLHRQNGLPYSAIAEQLQVSVSSVEKYILQALRACREALEALEDPAARK
ncbi:sigma-70 family RNA polymerase sigma factor [Mangrovimicrobium sediminis]|uniref:Sigma-70 family RNA polymerase sigma factor n=1 Tax=Mangrovimicrobium sediminis TaxID=2562682 RepID=A0A4Z0M0Z4_9GAMM|nr:sigma-70 family RNA polymerase sigma factor [Haliea sp. SAOS-164]TGD72965.1 sigma-70 family RNA polymerase sigma factor [Haliea sp. SAOS-164]